MIANLPAPVASAAEAALEMALDDPLLFATVILLVILATAAGMVAHVTVALRLANIRKEKAWKSRESVWTPAMIRVLAGESPPAHLEALVYPEDRYLFIDFLTRFAMRFDDHEHRLIEAMAAPHLPLILARLSSPDSDLRTRAVITIGVLGARAHAAKLVEALDAEEPIVVLSAARALCRLGEESVVRVVLLHIHKAESWSINFLARVVAGAGHAAIRPCREFLEDASASPWHRILAAESLRAASDLGSAELARRLLATETSLPHGVACACLRVIRDLGTDRHLDVVRDLWGSPDDAIRLNAVAALGGAGTRADLPRLRLMIQDESQWVVWAAVRGILELGDRDFLRDLVTSGHRAGPAAATVLAEHGLEEAGAASTVPGSAAA